MRDAFYRQCESVLGGACLDRSQDPPVLLPPSPQVLTELVRCTAKEKQGLRITGGGTMPVKLAHQASPIVSLAGLDGIPEVNVDDRLVVAQAGATADRVRALSEEYGLSVPLGNTSGEQATIGGMYMTDAYVGSPVGSGTMHSWVIGVTAVASTGDLVMFGGRTVKNVTGFDVTRMLAGTRGLYAISTQLILKALPAPEYRRTVTLTVPAKKLGAVFERIGRGISQRMERCDVLAPDGLGGIVTVGITVEGFNRLVKDRAREITDAVSGIRGLESRSTNPDNVSKVHRALSQTITGKALHTVTVPPAALPVLLAWIGENAAHNPVVAHALHGRVHVSDLDDETVGQLSERSRAIGGTMPIAWGSELNRGSASPFNEAEMALARSLKRQLDPDGIFNPHLWV